MLTEKTFYCLQYPKGDKGYPYYVGLDDEVGGYPYPASEYPTHYNVFMFCDESRIPDYLLKMEPKFNIVEVRWAIRSVRERK